MGLAWRAANVRQANFAFGSVGNETCLDLSFSIDSFFEWAHP